MMQSIIFDMDGTLFQTNRILEPALKATFDVLRDKGLWQGATPIEKYREIMGVPLPVVWATLCPNHSEEIRQQSNKLFQEKLIKCIQDGKGALYDGVEKNLSALKQNYKLFVASNGQEEYLQQIVDTYELNRYFEGVYSIQLISSGDKAKLVEKVIKNHGISKGVVVGDRLSDIRAAKDNNLLAIAVDFDFAQVEELKQADYVITSFDELLLLI